MATRSERFRHKRVERGPVTSEARPKTWGSRAPTWKDALEQISALPARAVRELVSEASSVVDRLSAESRKAGAGRPLWVRQAEAAAVQLLQPLVRRLDVASRTEVNRLSRQVDELERALRQRPRRHSRATTKHAAGQEVRPREAEITTMEEPFSEDVAAVASPHKDTSEEIPVIASAASD